MFVKKIKMIGSRLESKSGFFHHVYRGKRKVEKNYKTNEHTKQHDKILYNLIILQFYS